MPWVDGDDLSPANLNAKGATFVNVRDEDYGAVADGTTDDVTALELAASSADTGATLYLSAGTYVIGSPFNINKSISVLCDPNAVLLVSGNGRVDIGSSSTFLSNIIWRGGTIDCAAGNASAYGISAFISSGCLIEDVTIKDSRSVGISVSGNTTERTWATIRRSHISTSWDNGIVTNTGASDVVVENCVVENSNVSVAGAGVYMRGPRSTIRECTVDTTGDNALRVQGRDSRIERCYVTNFIGDGIRLMASNGVASSCIADTQTGGGSGHAFRVTDSTGSIVEGCTLSNCIGRNAANGLRIDSAGSGNSGSHRVLGCLFEYNAADGMNITAGDWTVLTGNSCYSNTRDGIRGDDVLYLTAGNNQCRSNGSIGINQITSGASWTIVGNIAVDNGTSSITWVDATVASNLTDQP